MTSYGCDCSKSSQRRMRTSESETARSARESSGASESCSRVGSGIEHGSLSAASRESGALSCRSTRRRRGGSQWLNSEMSSASAASSASDCIAGASPVAVASGTARATRCCSRTSDAAHQRSSRQRRPSPGKRCTATANSRTAYSTRQAHGTGYSIRQRLLDCESRECAYDRRKVR